MNSLDFNLTLGIFSLGLGITIASVVSFFVVRWVKSSAVKKTRKEFESRLPLTIEEIEAERELTRAQHRHELRLLELKISELQLKEAEANVKTSTALGRINTLNNRVELLRLALAAAQKRKKVDDEEPNN